MDNKINGALENEEAETDETTDAENETKQVLSDSSLKERTIAEIMKAAKIREALSDQNKNYQYKLSAYIKESSEKDYFQTLDLPLIANESDFAETLKKIDDKKDELEEFRGSIASKLEYLNTEIKRKQEELTTLRNMFSDMKEKVALQAVNSETGECFTKQEVEELLKKEEKMAKILEFYQLEAIKKRKILEAAIKDKKNLVEGPLDYGEYEIMCTKTENNEEIIKQLKQEIKDYTTKSAKVVNALSHLNQKLLASRIEKSSAQEKEAGMEKELDQEKTEYTSMSAKNKELQHKCILLQHPRLLEDHNNVVEENEQAKKELEELKNKYESLVSSIYK
ncbi:hypothetical protein JTE90_019036 [Oedothorax gibbosus]|uniref:Uncharacterized protein n=1 Tax=Oedothorax gibbosus TaxID=931172 RepID=A0AAV6UY67_9ARAC|nr:hypothetical protein JTE90_019036 [Oedothorax gibbosus]